MSSKEAKKFSCDQCQVNFSRAYNLKRHKDALHAPREKIAVFSCHICGESFRELPLLHEHFLIHPTADDWTEKQSAHQKAAIILTRVLQIEDTPEILMRDEYVEDITNVINVQLQKHPHLKIALVANCLFDKVNNFEQNELVHWHLRSDFYKVTAGFGSIEEIVLDCVSQIVYRVEDLRLTGSGWNFKRIIHLNLECVKQKTLEYGCDNFIDLKSIPNSKYLLTIPNTDERCFIYCIMSFMLQDEIDDLTNSSDKKYLQLFKRFDLDGITFPMKHKQIELFFKQNAWIDISAHILVYCQKHVYSHGLYGKGSRIVPLLCLPLENTKSAKKDSYIGIGHFVRVLDINSYLTKVYSPHSRQKMYYCLKCFQSRSEERLIKDHEKTCSAKIGQVEQYPQEGVNDELKFRNYDNQYLSELVGFYDFESILLPNYNTSRCGCMNFTCKCTESFTEATHFHKGIIYSLLIVDMDGKVHVDRTEFCEKGMAGKKLMSFLLDIEMDLKALAERNTEMINAPKISEALKNQKSCYYCHRDFSTYNNEKLGKPSRNHTHYNGQYVALEHAYCNLNRQRKKTLSLFCLLLEGMDDPRVTRKNIICQNTEKFKYIRINDFFEFKDSYLFLNFPLAKLMDDHKTRATNFPFLKQALIAKKGGEFCEERYNILLEGKSVIPYERICDYSYLVDTTEVPPIEHYYSSLRAETISQSLYDSVKTFWKAFDIKNMKQYAEVYCSLDVFLLCECFMAFNEMVFRFSNLDPCRYISLAQLSNDIFLRMTRSRISLITEPRTFHFVEKIMRGGYVFTNTKFCDLSLSPPGTEILYIDLNNLYGEAQSMPIPSGDYIFLEKEAGVKMVYENWDSWTMEQEIGYYINCDLSYDEKYHDSHSMNPLAPEVMKFDYKDLSPVSRSMLNAKTYKAVKLSASFRPRKRYHVHYMCLQFYLRKGMRLDAVHEVLQFRQSPFIKPFIDLMTQKRKESKTIVQTSLFKSLNNSNYGRSVMKIRDLLDCHFVKSKRHFMWLASLPNFHSFKIVSERLTVVYVTQAVAKVNKAWIIGATILELAKLIMQRNWHDFIIPNFDDVDLLFSDTDSYCFSCKVPDLNAKLASLKWKFDFSNLPKDHILYDSSKKNCLGLFKIETKLTTRIICAICLRSKCYCLLLERMDDTKELETITKAKGVDRSALNELTYQNYYSALFADEKVFKRYQSIRTMNYQLLTITTNKLSLSSMDDKRFLLACRIHSLPHGSIYIQENCFCPRCNMIWDGNKSIYIGKE